VRDAVGAVVGRGVPLAILPVGTANNIATALGIEGKPRNLARGWDGARRLRVDLGSVRGPWGQSRFIEGVGFGLVPEAIAAAREHGKKRLARGGGGAIRGARRLYRRTLARLEPVPLKMTADGGALDGEYLLVQVLNIPSVGPNLVLSPDANPSDGFFDLVTAGAGDREAVAALLDEKSRPAKIDLPRRRVRRVEVSDWSAIHVDDEVKSSPSTAAGAAASIELETGGVEFLVPGQQPS
jgi:diacylglycerol kinase family enzyme